MSKGEAMTYTYKISSIDCAACAKELEEEIGKLDGVSNCHIEFGVASVLSYDCDPAKAEEVGKQAARIIREDQGEGTQINEVRDDVHSVAYSVESIDCAACAQELEEEIGKLDGVSNCHIEFGIKSRLTYDVLASREKAVEEAMRNIIIEDQGAGTKITPVSQSLKGYVYTVHGLADGEEASRLRNQVAKISGVQDCAIDFGMTSSLRFRSSPQDAARIEQEIRSLLSRDQTLKRVYKKKEASVDDEDREKKEATLMLGRIIAGAVLFVLGMVLEGTGSVIFALAAYIVLGYDVIGKAFRSIGHGQLFDEHFLMMVATFAALYMRDFKEAAGVMLFYQIGEYFQDRAVARSRRSIGDLMNLRADYAEVERDGEFVKVDPEEVLVHERVRVKPGERIPLDGVVVEGASSLDTSSLTGESKVQDVDAGDEVLSGCVNQTGVIIIEVTKEYGDSTAARILDLVENSESKKASPEKFITKFSRWYTPAVVFAAIVTAIITAIVLGDVNEGIRRACTFLVISCPCALVISIPLSFFAGIGGLSSRGVLVKGASVVETLSKVKNVVFDKTGTLTNGTFAVEHVCSPQVGEKQLIHDAAAAEHFSNHPIAQGIRAKDGGTVDETLLSDAREIAGRGISIKENGVEILAGNYKLMQEHGITCKEETEAGTLVYVARGGKYEGCLVLLDQVKNGAEAAVNGLKKAGCAMTIVSGDNQQLVRKVADDLGIEHAIGQCLPEDKVAAVRKICEAGTTAFVGDGVNDAPVLAMADVGFAMGALGSDAAIEAADVVLMDDDLAKIPLAISSSQRIQRVASENIWFAIAIKLITLVLGAMGIANMWMAIFADTGVAMLCVLNSLRLLRIRRK